MKRSSTTYRWIIRLMVTFVAFWILWGWVENALKQAYLKTHPPQLVIQGQLDQPARLEAVRFFKKGEAPETDVHELPAGPFELTWQLAYPKMFELMSLEVLDAPNELYIKNVSIRETDYPVTWQRDSLRDVLWFPYIGGFLERDMNTPEGHRFKIRHEDQKIIFRARFKETVTEDVFRVNPFWIGAGTLLLSFLLALILPARRLAVLSAPHLFLFLGFCGTLLFAFFREGDKRPLENRLPAAFPDVANTHIWELPGKIDQWYNDRFPERHNISRADNWIKYDVFGVSPRPDLVLIGSEGWVYGAQPSIVRQYRGTDPFTAEELTRIRENLEIRRDWLRIHGADFYVVIPPSKHEIYPEFLPPRIRPVGDTSRLDQLTRYLQMHSDIQFIDLKTPLLKHKADGQLYYRTDTHWNQLGAWYGYATLINTMRAQHDELAPPTPIDEFRIDTLYATSGDLLSMANMIGKFDRTMYHFVPKRERQAEPRQSASNANLEDEALWPSRYFTTADSARPDLFMIRDSYAEYLYHNLAEHFNHSTFFWTRELPFRSILAEQPDIVLQESLGSFIESHLEPNPDTVVAEVMRYRATQQAFGPIQN